MKIVIAPDSFKGTLTAKEVAMVIKDSFRRVFDEKGLDSIIEVAPIADGGEGTSTVLQENIGGVKIEKTVTGPEFKSVDAFYTIINQSIAVIEVAETSGLKHCPNLDTKQTTTYGFGEMILDALDKGVTEVILCLGGSGTTDGGVGMATALGASFILEDSSISILTGESLHLIQSISIEQMDPRIANVSFKILSDVNNPLYGTTGAAYVYGPQKGASMEDIYLLNKGLQHYGNQLYKTFHKDCSSFPGAGAAGGLGAGCFAFLDAEVQPGIYTVLDMIAFDDLILTSDIIITGEGRIDNQSFMGKAISGVINHAKGKQVFLICGENSCNDGCTDLQHLNIFAATDYVSKEESLQNPVKALQKAAEACAYYITENSIK